MGLLKNIGRAGAFIGTGGLSEVYNAGKSKGGFLGNVTKGIFTGGMENIYDAANPSKTSNPNPVTTAPEPIPKGGSAQPRPFTSSIIPYIWITHETAQAAPKVGQ